MVVLSVGLIGLGRIGKVHFANLVAMNDLYDVRFIVDPYVQAVCSEYKGVEVCTDLDDAMEKHQSIDAVFICTPTDTHYDLIRSSLKRGLHVFSEKPLSHNMDEVKAVYDMARCFDKVLMCGMNRRWDPAIRELRARVQGAKIHTITTTARDFPHPTKAYLETSGGIFHDCGVHDLDIVLWFMNGRLPSVVSSMGNVRPGWGKKDLDLDDAFMMLQYDTGEIMSIHLSRHATSYDQRVEVFTDKGEFRVVNEMDPFLHDEVVPISFNERYQKSYIAGLQHFHDCCTDRNVEWDIQECDMVNVLKVVDACEKSFTASGVLTAVK